MHGSTLTALACLTVFGGLIATAHALDAKNGYSATQILTIGDVQTDVTYSGAAHVVDWQDLAALEFWAPIGTGQRDAIAANGAGDLFLLVRGYDSVPSGPVYTGLVRFDGTTLTSLVQDRMSSDYLATRTGAELQAVVTSPTSAGGLTADDPVILRQVNTDVSGSLTAAFEMATVSRATGAESALFTFGAEASQARVAIDGSGTSSDGTIYVGPMSDGDIAALRYAGTGYTRTDVPTSFAAASGLAIDSAGDLYTFDAAAASSWGSLVSPYTDHEIVRVDPATGTDSTYAHVDGKQFVFDWMWDDTDALWLGLRNSGRKRHYYVAEAPAGGVTSIRDRVSESTTDPASIAAGADGALYVLENPFSSAGRIFRLDPTTGDGGGSGGGGNGKGKGKKK